MTFRILKYLLFFHGNTMLWSTHLSRRRHFFFLKKKHSNMVLPEEWWLLKILPKLAKYFFKRASNRKRTWNKSSQKQPTYLISQAHLWSLRWLPPPYKTLRPQLVSPEHTRSCNFDRLRCLLVDTPVSSSITSLLRSKGCFCLHLCISSWTQCFEHCKHFINIF